MTIALGIKTSPQAVDWAILDATWARIGEHQVIDSVWMNDHLTDIAFDEHGASLEALTAIAALVHHVPGKVVGHAVLAATFRHPAVLAKAATVLDHATGGRFIVGLGAGWHEAEHRSFGIPMPPMPERFDRFESAVHVLKALWSDAARLPPGVTRADPSYPLVDATNEPGTLTPGGPRLWLGGQKRRGIALVAAVADGWVMPAVVGTGEPTDVDYFQEQHDRIRAALADAGRDPATFDIVAQIPTGTTRSDREMAVAAGRRAVAVGATQVIFGMPPRLGPAGVDAVVAEVIEPVRAHLPG